MLNISWRHSTPSNDPCTVSLVLQTAGLRATRGLDLVCLGTESLHEELNAWQIKMHATDLVIWLAGNVLVCSLARRIRQLSTYHA